MAFKNVDAQVDNLVQKNDDQVISNDQKRAKTLESWRNSIINDVRKNAQPKSMASWLKDAPLRKLDETQIRNLLTQKDENGEPYDETILRRMAQHIQKYEPLSEKYAADLEDLTKQFGGQMVGLEYRLKRPTSLYRKVMSDLKEQKAKNNINYDIEDSIKGMKDVARFTIALNEDDDFAKNVINYMNAIKQKGYSPIKFQNSMTPNAPYKGINTNFRDPEGNIFELQFHTPNSMWRKERIGVDLANRTNTLDHRDLTSHDYYEATRVLQDLKNQGKITPEQEYLLELLTEENIKHWFGVRDYPDLKYDI